MTRINLISVSELSNQHLVAEYRELPRIINGVIDGKLNQNNIPNKYILGAGHVKFFTNKIMFLAQRYEEIHTEMRFRGFFPKYNPNEIYKKINSEYHKIEEKYTPSNSDIKLSRTRIIEKLSEKPDWYKWTNRKKPKYT